MLEIVDANSSSAEKNMERDLFFLRNLEKSQKAILHFYNWKNPSVTYGYFTDPQKFLYVEKLKLDGVDLARRPTGGGVIFHIWDFAFSLLIPASSPFFSQNTLQNYAFVHGELFEALRSSFPFFKGAELIQNDFPGRSPSSNSFCMAKPTKYDLIHKGKKIAGAAQRKTRFGFLHQGSLSLFKPDLEKLQKWVPDPEVLSSLEDYSYYFLQESKRELKDHIKNILMNHFQRRLNN